MADVNSWNVAAASNNAAPPDGWPEGMAYSAVNNSARENMAAIARWHKDMNGSLVGAGIVNAYTVTLNQTYAAYFTGLVFACSINITNTGAATLNVNAIGVKNIINDQSGAALVANALIAGQIYAFRYDGTSLRLLGNFDGTLSLARLTSTTAVALASTAHALQIGATAGANLRADTGNVQAVNNGAIAALGLNPLDGAVNIGALAGTQPISLRNKNVAITEGGTAITPANIGATLPALEVHGAAALMALDRFSADANSTIVTQRKSRNATVGAHTIVQSGDQLAEWSAYGSNGTSYDIAAAIRAFVDATPGASNDMPGRLSFYTTPDATAALVEAWRITQAGILRSMISLGTIEFVNTNTINMGMSSATLFKLRDLTNAKDFLVATIAAGLDFYHNNINSLRTKAVAAGSSGGEVLGPDSTFRDIGFNVMPENTQDAPYTIAVTDAGKLIRHSDGTARTYTLNTSSLPTGAILMIHNDASAAVNVTIAKGTITNLFWVQGDGSAPANVSRTLARNGIATIWMQGPNTAYVWGTGLS